MQHHPLALIGFDPHSRLSPGAACETPSAMALRYPSRHIPPKSVRSSQSLPTPPPPPRHSVATPRPPPRRRNSQTNEISTREPLEPIGCPKATAPPFTLTRDQSQSNSFPFASACAANASLTSITSNP